MKRTKKEPDVQRSYFDKQAQTYDSCTRRMQSTWGLYHSSKVLSIVSKIIPKKVKAFGDIGCGTGTFTKLFVEKANTVIGVDISRTMLRVAGKCNALHTVQGDAVHLPLNDNIFDVVLCIDTLHHLPNLRDAMQELKRITCKDGLICIMEPNHNWAHNFRCAILRAMRKMIEKVKPEMSYEISLFLEKQHLTRGDLEQLESQIPLQHLENLISEAGLVNCGLFYYLFIPPEMTNRLLLRVLGALETLLERLPLIKEMGGKICLVAQVRHG